MNSLIFALVSRQIYPYGSVNYISNVGDIFRATTVDPLKGLSRARMKAIWG